MHLRLGRTTSKTRSTPIVLHSPQQHLRPPHRSSPLMLLRPRALSLPRLVGRARHGTARMKMRIITSRAVTSHNKALQIRRTKKSILHHACLALNNELIYPMKLSLSSLDRIRGGHNVSTHANLKMERACHRAHDHHHLWCDKVNEKRTLLTVLLVS